MPGRGNVRFLWSTTVSPTMPGGSPAPNRPWGDLFHASGLLVNNSDYIKSDDSNSVFDYGFGDAFTVSMWARPEGIGSGTTDICIDLRTIASKNGIIVKRLDTGSGDFWQVTSYDATTNTNDLSSAPTSGTDVFRHIVYTKDGANEELFIDGNSVASSAAAETTSSVDRALSIGAVYSGTNDFSGTISDVAIWNTALSADEIKEIFQKGSHAQTTLTSDFGSYVSSANLKSWYRLGKLASNPAKDYGPNGHDMTGGVATDTSYTNDCPMRSFVNLQSENLANTTAQAYGMGSSWSLALVTAQRSLGTNEYWVDLVGASNNSTINISEQAAGYRIVLRDTAGTVFKQYEFASTAKYTQGKHRWVFTYDGTDLKIYQGGVEITPTKTTDNAGTMADSNRTIGIGASSAGFFQAALWFSTLALWNTALTAAEVKSLYWEGAYDFVDLKNDFFDYESSADLSHWWVAQPIQTGQAGGEYIADLVDSGGIDIDVNDSGGISALIDLFSISHSNGIEETGGPPGACLYWNSDADNRLESSAALTTGVGDAWTIAGWVNIDDIAPAGDLDIFNLKEAADNDNRIRITAATSIADDPFQVVLYDTSNTVQKDYRWGENITENDTWLFFAVTWDGTNLTTYTNGDEDTAPTKTTDNALTMVASDRFIGVGCEPDSASNEFEGWISTVGVWSSELSATEIRDMYRQAYFFKPTENYGDYASSSSLVAYYKPGADGDSLGFDYSENGHTLDQEVNITVEDLRPFGPAAQGASGN